MNMKLRSYEVMMRWYFVDGTKSKRISVYGVDIEETKNRAGCQLGRDDRPFVVACEYAVIELDRFTGGSIHYEVIDAVCELSWFYHKRGLGVNGRQA